MQLGFIPVFFMLNTLIFFSTIGVKLVEKFVSNFSAYYFLFSGNFSIFQNFRIFHKFVKKFSILEKFIVTVRQSLILECATSKCLHGGGPFSSKMQFVDIIWFILLNG